MQIAEEAIEQAREGRKKRQGKYAQHPEAVAKADRRKEYFGDP
jgi:hypothetical protein